jgi:hypothetical protein
MEAESLWLLIAVLAWAGGMALGWAWRGRQAHKTQAHWPKRWDLNARPLFSAHERALYRELRAALPHHVVLAKVSLLRFCQAADQGEAKRWYERLQALHVALTVCTPNGVVITAIDIDHNADTQSLRRSQRMKEAALEACRVRYIRCRPGQWPQATLLAAWALGQWSDGTSRVGNPDGVHGTVGTVHDAGDQLARKLRQRRAERAARWAESSFAQDSFFAFDSRLDGAANSSPVPLMDFHESQASAEPVNQTGPRVG